MKKSFVGTKKSGHEVWSAAEKRLVIDGFLMV